MIVTLIYCYDLISLKIFVSYFNFTLNVFICVDDKPNIEGFDSLRLTSFWKETNKKHITYIHNKI